MTLNVSLPVSLLLLAAYCGQTYADDWPQWRGPNRTGVSTEIGLMKSWPAGGPQRLWLNERIGVGYSGPAIVGDRLFVMGTRDNNEMLFAIDVNEGTEIWAAVIDEVLENGWGDGPRATPTVDTDEVYAMGAQGTLVCVSMQSGEPVWTRRMSKLGGQVPNWGYCESVLVDGDQLVCTPGGGQGAMVALDKTSGDLIWQSSKFTDGAQYSSIIAADHNDARQYIQLTKQSLVGIAANDGNVLWRADWPGRTAVIPTPIFRDGYVYVSSGYNVGCGLFHVSNQYEVTEIYGPSHEPRTEASRAMKNHHGGMILFGDHVYGYSDGKGWVCQDFATGELSWRNKKLGKGSVTLADGMLYCVSEKEGDVVLAEATPDAWNEVSRFRIAPQSEIRKPRGRIWTHPVVANGHLFLRDQELLFCFDVRDD